jgi:hypothetical protein
METSSNIFSTKPKFLCESKISSGHWWSYWLSVLALWPSHVRMSLLYQLAHASRAIRATLLARQTNNRVYVGIVILALAPVCEVVYRLFKEQINPNAYWDTYYFLYTVGPHLNIIATLTGVFLLFPSKHKTRYIIIIPVMYKFAKIVWLSTVTNNEDFHRSVPLSYLLIGALTATAWFLIFDYLMSLHFHKKMGTVARIVGILTSPGIDEKKAYTIARQEAINYQTLNK